jgi:glycerol uptake facilitator-like aquaporin
MAANEQRNTDALIQFAADKDLKAQQKIQILETAIEERVKKDSSPEAKLGRAKMTIRAVYGEFMCALLFYGPIFGCLMNFAITDPTNVDLRGFAVAFVGGFQAIGISFAFSSVSGAHFNSAISFALWLTGKLSNRRMIFYVLAQLSASVVAMAIMTGIFHGDLTNAYLACTVTPTNRMYGRVFATEFFLTFFLTYIAFTVAFEEAESQKKDSMSFKSISDSKGLTLYASTPQSKAGFAPFSIGFTIFSLSLIGGTSGGAFNPGRIFGPAMFANKWDYLWLYWIGEVMGASFAGLLVTNLHKFGLKEDKSKKVADTSALETMGHALNKKSKGTK